MNAGFYDAIRYDNTYIGGTYVLEQWQSALPVYRAKSVEKIDLYAEFQYFISRV